MATRDSVMQAASQDGEASLDKKEKKEKKKEKKDRKDKKEKEDKPKKPKKEKRKMDDQDLRLAAVVAVVGLGVVVPCSSQAVVEVQRGSDSSSVESMAPSQMAAGGGPCGISEIPLCFEVIWFVVSIRCKAPPTHNHKHWPQRFGHVGCIERQHHRHLGLACALHSWRDDVTKDFALGTLLTLQFAPVWRIAGSLCTAAHSQSELRKPGEARMIG